MYSLGRSRRAQDGRGRHRAGGGVVFVSLLEVVSAPRRSAANGHERIRSGAGREAMAILMRRTLTRTRAPIFNSLSRIVPQVAAANWVWRRAIRGPSHGG